MTARPSGVLVVKSVCCHRTSVSTLLTWRESSCALKITLATESCPIQCGKEPGALYVGATKDEKKVC